MADATTDRARSTLGRQIRRGVSWNAANLVVNKGMSILVRLLLARLLVPEHFGLVAMVIVVLGLIKIFVDFGLQNALIQRKRDANSLIRNDSAFWFLLGGGIGWTALFIIAGIPLMIWAYDEPQLRDLALVMSVSILLHSLSIMPTVRLTRRMRFKSQVIAEVVSTVAASVIAIALAFAGAGVWALAAQQLSSGAIKSAMLWRAAAWRPRRRFSWASLQDVVGFSGWMLGISVLDYIRLNLDKVLIGAMLSPAILGVYAMAFALTEAFRASLSRVVTKVMFPAFSKEQNNLPRLTELFLTTTRKLSTIVGGVVVIIILYADRIIPLLLNENWDGIIPLIQLLSLAGLVYAIGGPTAEALKAIGKPELYLRVSFTNVVFFVIPITIALTIFFEAEGAAIAAVLSMALLKGRTLWVLSRQCPLTARGYLLSLFPFAVIVVSALAMHYGLKDYFSDTTLIAISVFAIGSVYLISEKQQAIRLSRNLKRSI